MLVPQLPILGIQINVLSYAITVECYKGAEQCLWRYRTSVLLWRRWGVHASLGRLLNERNVSTLTDSLDPRECIIEVTDAHPQGTLGEKERFPGRAVDSPPPGISQNIKSGWVLVPQSWIEENWDTFVENYHLVYLAFGGAATASDQMNSLSQAHHEAAGTFTFEPDENFWANLFPAMFDISDKTNFPPVYGSNHAGSQAIGPLKEDWTKMCPEELTFAERNEKCISFQEVIYGTERLKRLETIKMKVDPNFMFDCDYCILNNRPKEAVQDTEEVGGSEEETSVTPAGTSDGSRSSVQLFYAMAVFSAYSTIM